jgi:hypothetical protein
MIAGEVAVNYVVRVALQSDATEANYASARAAAETIRSQLADAIANDATLAATLAGCNCDVQVVFAAYGPHVTQ